MLKYHNEEQLLFQGLTDMIGLLPGAKVWADEREVRAGPQARIDALVDVTIDGRPLRLVVEAKRQAYPRDVRQAIYQLRKYIAQLPATDVHELVPFFMANSISPGARDLLREERIGFYDLGGSLFIPANHAYILIDRPPPPATARNLDRIFQGQRARVVMEVVERRPEWLGVKGVAEATGVSPATASATLSEMERREWVEVEGAGPAKLRRLRDPAPVIDAWAGAIAERKPPALARYYVPVGDVGALARRLDAACARAGAVYAVTSEVAAQAYAPHLSSISQLRCRIAPGPAQDAALAGLDARRVKEGWNLGVLETRSPGDVITGPRIDGVTLAPALQVYLDLLQGSGRARDMAAHLRAERLERA